MRPMAALLFRPNGRAFTLNVAGAPRFVDQDNLRIYITAAKYYEKSGNVLTGPSVVPGPRTMLLVRSKSGQVSLRDEDSGRGGGDEHSETEAPADAGGLFAGGGDAGAAGGGDRADGDVCAVSGGVAGHAGGGGRRGNLDVRRVCVHLDGSGGGAARRGVEHQRREPVPVLGAVGGPSGAGHAADGDRRTFYWIPEHYDLGDGNFAAAKHANFWTSAFTYDLEIQNSTWKQLPANPNGLTKYAVLRVWPGDFGGSAPQSAPRIFYREILPVR
jgi:hypothetical protein